MITAFIIFVITYSFIGIRQIPRVKINRPAGALIGAVLMVVFGVLTLDQAFEAIDMHTLLLLLGMMIITVYLRDAGFFELMADKILSFSKTPLQLLILVVISSGILSTFAMDVTSVAFAEASVSNKREQPKVVTIEPSNPLASPRSFKIVLFCNYDESRSKGLQGFRRLKNDEAALFVFEPPEAVTFWMGSVAYSIDIIFINRDNKVVRVYPHCMPGSREYYFSIERIKWVIETDAGSEIKPGDRVHFK